MFLTKRDVDRHCQDVMNKCKNEKDRNLRCLTIAQQYYNVRDYESARRYISLFLSVKDDSPIAHKLYAQCLEYFGEKEKALTEYKYSLSLDPKQPELYLKVCELYADSSIIVDKNEARYWHDKGEGQFPYHPAIHKLKQKMFAIGDSQNGKSFESDLLDELKEKSHDPIVNAKLLNFYIDNGRVREAYDQAFRKKINFVPNLSWYQCGVQICKSYKNKFPTSLNEEFYGNYLLVLERCLALSVQDVKMRRMSIPECISLLASFDELLSEATAINNKSERLLIIINHMCGQLCFYTAHILYRKAKWEDKSWLEMSKLISPLLLLSTASRFDIRKVKEDGPFSQILKTSVQVNIHRINQAGYILTTLAKESPKHFIEKIFHSCVSNYWRERICETIYTTSNYKAFSKSSFFIKFDGFSSLPDELPKNVTNDIDIFLSVTEALYPSSLHHLVWIGMHYLNISNKNSICDSVLPLKFTVKFTGALQFTHNSSSTYAENLSKIDIEAFLFACVYCAKASLDQQIDKSKPLASYILPADVSKLLCSPDHDLWWDYVYQMINQAIAEEHYSRARSVIQRGIENIRLIGNNVLPLHLLVLLGRTFANKATVESDSIRASALEARSLLYWKTALPLLEKVVLKESYLTSSKSMFEYPEKIITPIDAAKLISEGKRFVGMQMVKEKDYSETMFLNEIYEEPKINSPVSAPPSNHHSLDDNMLKSLFEQNTKIIDKLETLFNKQELLSSNQFHLFETISALSKKIDDVLIMPNDCYLDALSANEPSVSPHNVSQVSNTNANSRSAPAVPVQPLVGSNFYSIPSNVQTNFPIHPLGHPTFNATAVTTSASFLNPYLAVPPQPSFPLTPLQNYPFVSDTKESYMTANRSIASSVASGSVNTTPSAARVPAALSQPMNFGELFDANRSQANFADYCNLFQDTFVNSPTKANEVLPPATTSTSSLFLQNKISFLPKATISATPFGSTVVSTAPFSSPVVSTTLFSSSVVPTTPFSSPVVPTAPFSSPVGSTAPFSSPVVTTAPHSFQITNIAAPSVLLPSVQVPEDDYDSDDGDERVVEHDPIPDFKPIIPLPDEVAVKTGEEEEEVLFESRAKLYRFANKEWKERGIGPLKILKNKVSGRVRVLMRREVVHKICANHFLSEDMDLKPMSKNDRAWIYSAPDFADETLVVEQFCVKFASPEIANKFFNVFNEHKKTPAATAMIDKTSVEQQTPVASPVPRTSTPASASSAVVKPDEKLRKAVIAPPVLNVSGADKAPAAADTSKVQLGGFTFNAKPILTSVLEQKEPATVAKPGAVVDDKKNQPFASFTGFTLNGLSRPEGESKLFSSATALTSSTPAFVSLEEKNAGLFTAVENALDFSSLSKNADNAGFVKSKDFKGFAGAGAPVFGAKFAQVKSAATVPGSSPLATVLNSTPAKTETSSSRTTESPQDAANDGEYEPTAEFKPVIPLPDLVDVKTGEEGLEVLYEEHCKLFRYTDDQWKERGVGKMKILRDPKDGGVRLLMRRDQVHKLCCNQRLTAKHELQTLKTTDKAWSWIGQDFSEGELKSELLCVRFKTVEMASAFKEAFNNAKAQLPITPAASQTASPASNKTVSSTLPSLSEMFKRDQTMWDCKMCYVSNKKDDSSCVACQQPKDGVSPPKASSKPSIFSSSGGSSFTFSANPTSPATSTIVAGTTAGPATSSSAFSFGIPPVTSSLFSFGVQSASSTVPAGSSDTVTTVASSSQNGAPVAPVFSFGSQPSQKSESGGALFSNTKFLFGNNSALSSSQNADNNSSAVATSKSEAPPPPFSLFSGTGNSSSGSAFSSFSFKLTPSGGGNELKTKQAESKLNAAVVESSSSDEVEFVSETNASEEDIKLAKSLMLPPNYFAYKYINKDCPGCVGCDEEDRKISDKVSVKINFAPEPSLKSADSPSMFKTSIDSDLIKKPPNIALSGFAFGKTENSSWLDKSSFSFSNAFNFKSSNVPASSTPEKAVGSPKKVEEDEGSDDEKDASVVPNDQDPYFEPVIAMPNLVEVKTGEEEETIEFCERSKLFRFDEEKKEWKERGVGELKVLFHPDRKSYRLLMRREQVHKVVLNQRITTALNLQILSSNANSWCWFGMNLPEEHAEPVLEKLAARFKTEEISNKFKEVVSRCLTQLMSSEKNAQVAGPSDVYNLSNVSEEEEPGSYDYSNEHDYYVDEEAIEDAMEDVGDAEVVFDTPVTLKIFEGDTAADYEGIIRLVRKNPDIPSAENLKSYVEFSTHDVPLLYCAEINKNSQALLENDSVTIVDDVLETERKITIQFQDSELCVEFLTIYDMIK